MSLTDLFWLGLIPDYQVGSWVLYEPGLYDQGQQCLPTRGRALQMNMKNLLAL